MIRHKSLNLKEEIGERIRALRGKIKQKDFAEMVGIHKNQLNRYEKGRSLPRPEVLKRIYNYAEKSDESTQIHEKMESYRIETDSRKKLIDNINEILDSGNEVMAEALKANIKAFLEAVRTVHKKNGYKNPNPDEEQ